MRMISISGIGWRSSFELDKIHVLALLEFESIRFSAQYFCRSSMMG